MARRHRSSPAENFLEEVVELASELPWWATIPTAFLLFVFVPFELSMFDRVDSANMTWSILSIFTKGFFKYLIPFALVLGTLVGIIRRSRSHALFSSISKRGVSEVISKLSWQEFEFLLSEWFRKQGYSIEITGGGGADGGIDIKLYKDGKISLVQCKHYKVWKVSVRTVREFFGIITAENASGGYIVTSGRFTNEAYAFAAGKNIQLISGQDLIEMFDTNDLSTAKNLANAAMLCPKCAGQLIERNGKFGKFLGCDNYPKCKYTKDLK